MIELRMLKKQVIKIVKIIAILAIIVGGGFVGIRGIYSALEWEKPLANLQETQLFGVSGVFKTGNFYYGLAVGSSADNNPIYYDSTSWRAVEGPGSGFSFQDVWTQDYQNFWVVGKKVSPLSGVLYHFFYDTATQTGSWNDVGELSKSGYEFYDVSGAVTDDGKTALFVVGKDNSGNGVVYYKLDLASPDNFALYTIPSPGAQVNAVSVVSNGTNFQAWATVADGRIYNYDGTSSGWSEVASGLGELRGITAVKGISGVIDYWTVNGIGEIYEKGNPLPVHSAGHPLNSISGVYDANKGIYKVWAVGDPDSSSEGAATIFNYDGSNWKSQNQGAPSGLALKDVFAINPDHVWAVGSAGGKGVVLTLSPGNLGGWIWMGADNCGQELGSCPSGVNKDLTLGWISLNCADLGLCLKREFTYGVNIDEGATDPDFKPLEGYAWFGVNDEIPNPQGPVRPISWLSFNRSANPSGGGTGNPPDEPYKSGTGAIAKYEPATGKLSGWARLLELKNEYGGQAGWVKLRGNSSTNPNDNPPAPYDSSNHYEFSNCYGPRLVNGNLFPADCDTHSPPDCDLKICETVKVNGIKKNYSCNQCGSWVADQSCNNDAGTCTACQTCDLYGVSADKLSGKVSGYAWSDNSSENQGVGWIDFSQAYYQGKLWLETLWSDIYSETRIGSGRVVTPPSGSYNATYMLQCGGPDFLNCTITNFTSAGPSIQIGTPPEFWTRAKESTMGEIIFPEGPSYNSPIGKIDYQGLVTKVGGTNKNKYGQEVVEYSGPKNLTDLAPFTISPGGNGILGGKVYHITGDLTINSTVEIKNGDPSGSGLIVIDGNVAVTGQTTSLSYERGPISKLKQLASLGFFIKGNLTIDKNITNLVGAYYVGGKAEVQGNFLKPGDDLQFVNYGPIIAKEFKFSRQFRGTIDGPKSAERIIYDGRVVANPPPGFDDLSKNLPIVREVMP